MAERLDTYAEPTRSVEIAKQCSLEPTAPELRFWSKSTVSEVDLVVSSRGYHIPFEIKLGRTFDRRWLRGLDAFEADHASLRLAISYCVVLCFGEPSRPDERTFVCRCGCLLDLSKSLELIAGNNAATDLAWSRI